MLALEPYIIQIEDIVQDLVVSKGLSDKVLSIEPALNGELSRTLRNLVTLDVLQASGAFFTGELMANKLVATLSDHAIANGVVFDPSCGGGNLLLAYAQRLPIKGSLSETLADWSERIKGIDIHKEFVRATRARLILLSIQRGMKIYGLSFFDGESPSLEDAFPFITSGDSLIQEWPSATVFLLNPPFNQVPAPKPCRWATGQVSQAALFVVKCLSYLSSDITIRAILPDVLRAGTRYRKWRELVATCSSIESTEVLGQFDTQTEVEVFLLTLKLAAPLQYIAHQWITLPSIGPTINQKIQDLFQVQVGRVVPYRDAEEGPVYPYLDVRHLPIWGKTTPGKAHRRFQGSTFSTPFVIVRRTSKASDLNRAVATLVQSEGVISEQVAVENHLLVLTPRSGDIEDCLQLMNILRDARTNDWLNNQIRCRHLTVKAVASIPYWVDSN